MRFAPLFFFLALTLTHTALGGNGVERGSIAGALANLISLAEGTKVEMIRMLENRCDLTGVVSATAEVADNDEPVDLGYRGFRVRLRLVVEGQTQPEIVVVRVQERVMNGSGSLAFSVASPICR